MMLKVTQVKLGLFVVLLTSFLPFVGSGSNKPEASPFPKFFVPLIRTSAELFEMSKGTDTIDRQPEGYYVDYEEYESHIDFFMNFNHTTMGDASSKSGISTSDDWSVCSTWDEVVRTHSDDYFDNYKYTPRFCSIFEGFFLWCYIASFVFAVKRVFGWIRNMFQSFVINVQEEDDDEEAAYVGTGHADNGAHDGALVVRQGRMLRCLDGYIKKVWLVSTRTKIDPLLDSIDRGPNEFKLVLQVNKEKRTTRFMLQVMQNGRLESRECEFTFQGEYYTPVKDEQLLHEVNRIANDYEAWVRAQYAAHMG